MLDSLIWIVAPLLEIVGVILYCRLRGLSLVEDIGLRLPAWRSARVWLLGLVLWSGVEEHILAVNGVDVPSQWRGYSKPLLLAMIVSYAVLRPLGEELLLRGVVFRQVARSRAGVVVAIVLTALLFPLVRGTTQPVVVALLVLDGVLLGTARYLSGSLGVPLLMHCLLNLYVVFQRVPVNQGGG